MALNWPSRNIRPLRPHRFWMVLRALRTRSCVRSLRRALGSLKSPCRSKEQKEERRSALNADATGWKRWADAAVSPHLVVVVVIQRLAAVARSATGPKGGVGCNHVPQHVPALCNVILVLAGRKGQGGVRKKRAGAVPEAA